MAQSVGCLRFHKDHLHFYENGIWICRWCAERTERAQQAQDLLIRLRMAERGLGLDRDTASFRELAAHP